jgi:hypothetical protein
MWHILLSALLGVAPLAGDAAANSAEVESIPGRVARAVPGLEIASLYQLVFVGRVR